jgi:exodeoxyribonuclease VII small subunit
VAKRKPDEGKKEEGAASGFEAALERLEEIVETMEGGDLALEEAMALFEEGVRLGQSCSKRLDEAERKITILLERADGAIIEQGFDATSAAAAEPATPPAAPRRAEAAPRRAAAPKPAPAPAARQAAFDEDDDRIPF